MKTSGDTLDSFARKHGANSFHHAINMCSFELINQIVNGAMKSYAREALREAAKKAILTTTLRVKGKEWGPIGSQTARLQSGSQVSINKESITNIELP